MRLQKQGEINKKLKIISLYKNINTESCFTFIHYIKLFPEGKRTVNCLYLCKREHNSIQRVYQFSGFKC